MVEKNMITWGGAASIYYWAQTTFNSSVFVPCRELEIFW